MCLSAVRWSITAARSETARKTKTREVKYVENPQNTPKIPKSKSTHDVPIHSSLYVEAVKAGAHLI